MSRSEDVLDECLQGAAPSQWKAGCPPDQAAELRPLLHAAAEIGAARGIRPPESSKADGRARLTAYLLAHPHPERRTAGRAHLTAPTATAILRRLSLGLVVAVALFLVVGTTYAQSALPGQSLYSWKRASEDLWRAVSPNPLGVDLQVSQRRTNEMLAVSGNASAEQEAQQGYQAVLSNLSTLPEPDARRQVFQNSLLPTKDPLAGRHHGSGSRPDPVQIVGAGAPHGSGSRAHGNCPHPHARRKDSRARRRGRLAG